MRFITFILLIFLTNISPNRQLDLPKDNSFIVSSLKVKLPKGYSLATEGTSFISILDENDVKKGWLLKTDFDPNYGYSNIKRNHSSLVSEEVIETPIGKAILYTLDVDNGTAASGILGTHYEYRAIIKIKDTAIYVLQYSNKDKRNETKEKFIYILKNLKF